MDIPLPPEITESDLQRCRDAGDFCPVLFQWYKYVGLLANCYASILRESPAIKDISKIHYAVLIGLLNRCSRLMLANIVLSHKGMFGEATSIIDRCIFESSIKLSWLCHKGDDDSFCRFIAEGLKTSLKFKETIEENTGRRSGETLVTENDMLTSINDCIRKSELTEEEISASKKLPDMASMIEVVGKPSLTYTVSQKIGSHHVHGTWVSLWTHYLEEVDGVIHPRDHNCETHINQYSYISLVVLDSIEAFVVYVCKEPEDIARMVGLVVTARNEMLKVYYEEVIGTDYEVMS